MREGTAPCSGAGLLQPLQDGTEEHLGAEGLGDVVVHACLQADLERLQRLAVTLVRRLFEGLYRRRENQQGRYTLVAAADSGIPDHYFKEIPHGH